MPYRNDFNYSELFPLQTFLIISLLVQLAERNFGNKNKSSKQDGKFEWKEFLMILLHQIYSKRAT